MSDDYNQKDELERLKKDIEPHNLSKIVCEAIKNQKDIDISIKGIIKEALEKDVDTRKIVKELIKESIREEGWQNWKHIIGWFITIILAFISGGYFK
jgi:hypothetical protein